MGCYYTKKQLYEVVGQLREKLNTQKFDYPINILEICHTIHNLKIDTLDFYTNTLRGIAALAETPKDNDVILLNKNRNETERNFDLAHELIHISLHRNQNIPSFNCFTTEKSNSFLEWQANEGAAEFLMPYRFFLPLIFNNLTEFTPYDIFKLKIYLSEFFNVTLSVIEIRLESLKYPIYQYLMGTDINEVQILSESDLKQQHINILSLNDIQKILQTDRQANVKLIKPKRDYNEEMLLKIENKWLYDV